MTKATK